MTLFDKTLHRWPLAILLAGALTLAGCEPKQVMAPENPAKADGSAAFMPVTVEHKLGKTVIDRRPQRVAALDMNEVDFLDQLGVPVAGMPKDFIPRFLTKYKDNQEIRDLGAIVQPNLEYVHAVKPDLILITSLQASHYRELSEIAPTIHFDVDYRDSEKNHVEVIRAHLLTLGKLFGKEDIAQQKVAALDAKVAEVKKLTQDRPEKALVVLHNNGAFSSFGPHSRYGFVFGDFGVRPAGPATEAGLHGQPISHEFIQQADPDIIYVVDRTAIMEHRPALDSKSMDNPLLRQTRAWKNGRIVFVDPEAWYTMAASPNSLSIMIDDVSKGYHN